MAKHLKISEIGGAGTLQSIFEAIMNVGCIVANMGYIPRKNDDYDDPDNFKWWAIQEGTHWDTVDLCPAQGNWKVFIREKSDTHMVIQFTCKHDDETDFRADALANLILARFNATVTDVTPS